MASSKSRPPSQRKAKSGHTFLKQRVKESIVITELIVLDVTQFGSILGCQMPRGWQQSGVCVVRKERLHLILAFGVEDGASTKEQYTTWLHQWPQGLEDFGLQQCQLGNIRLPSQPTNIRMTPHNA
jgi:hypothetical protein